VRFGALSFGKTGQDQDHNRRGRQGLTAADNLHAICARSASLLHARELRCYGKGQGWLGASVAWSGCGQAGASLLKSKLVRTLLVSLSSVRGDFG
jgi:hypothetical protein